MYHKRLFVWLVASMVLLDQATKIAIRRGLPIPEALVSGGLPRGRLPASDEKIEVIPGFFNIVHVENPGAAWGLLSNSDHRIIFFAVVTLAAFVGILFYYRTLRAQDRVLAWGLALIFSGAAGNFIDRMLYQHVTDFLDFYATGWAAPLARRLIGSTHWPAFNVADICICVGVGLFAVHVLVIERREARHAQTES